MNDGPLVSIIMNCYNCDEYLKQSINSALSQTYKNIEIIFWDNQSIDASAKIIKSYNDNRIRYFYSNSHVPLGRARNLAIKKACGEYIAFLDCDDLWSKDKIKLSLMELYKTPENQNISLIYSKSLVISENNNLVRENKKILSGDIHDTLLVDGNFIVFSSVMVRRDLLIECGSIDEELNYCEDFSMLLKISKDSYVIGVDEYLTSYRVHEKSSTKVREFENNIEVVNFLNSYIKDNNISGILKFNIFLQNSYRITSCFMKNFIIFNTRNCTFIIKNYIGLLLLFPLWAGNKFFNSVLKK